MSGKSNVAVNMPPSYNDPVGPWNIIYHFLMSLSTNPQLTFKSSFFYTAKKYFILILPSNYLAKILVV